MEWFKKIKHGLNLVGNKIINAKVDNPTQNEHISNKQYVDLGDKYDTTLATTKPVSTKFNWVNNVGNTTIKSTLDKLLFPIVYPIYYNPTLISYQFISINTSNFFNSFINGKLIFNIDNGDRHTTVKYKLIIKVINQVELIFESIDKDTLEINFNFLWKNIEYIKLTQIFTPVDIKNDSDEQPYIDNNFNSTYDFEYIFEIPKIEKELNIKKQLLSKLGETESNVLLNLSKDESTLKQEFITGNTINLISQVSSNTSTLNSCTLLIHESQINSLNGNIMFLNNTGNYYSIQEFLPNKYVLRNTNNEKLFVTFLDGNYYLCFIENLGKFSENMQVTINL